MKVLILDTIKPPGESSTVHMWEFMNSLSKLTQEVHAMTYISNKNFSDIIFHPIIKKKQNFLQVLFFRINYLINLIRIMSKYHFDVLYTRNGSIGIIGALMRGMRGSKLILELNGLISEDWKLEKANRNISIFNKLKMKFWDYIEILAAKKADAVISVSQGIKDILVEKGVDRNKIFVVPNGANVNLFKPIDELEKTIKYLRQLYGINKNDYVIVFVGNFEPHHGIEYLIKSAPLILREFPNTKFLIVGDGPIKNELVNLVDKLNLSDEIIFTGRIDYEKIPFYINLASVCVAPFIRARNEKIGLSPLKIYEYLACGKPVIASDIKGAGDLLRHSNAGIAVKPEDPVELANAIIKLLKDEELRRQMGENGRKVVVNNYSWDHTAKKTIEVFEKILDKKGDYSSAR